MPHQSPAEWEPTSSRIRDDSNGQRVIGRQNDTRETLVIVDQASVALIRQRRKRRKSSVGIGADVKLGGKQEWEIRIDGVVYYAAAATAGVTVVVRWRSCSAAGGSAVDADSTSFVASVS